MFSATTTSPHHVHLRKETPEAFSFKIAPDELARIERETNLPQRSTSAIQFILTEQNALFARRSTFDGGMRVLTRVALLEPVMRSDTGAIVLTFDKLVLRVLGRHASEKYVTFSYDQVEHRELLTCRGSTRSFTVRVPVVAQMADTETENIVFMGQSSAEHMKGGLLFGAYSKSEKDDSHPCPNVTVRAGAITGGSQRVLNRYSSPLIAPAIEFIQPKSAVPNFAAVLAKMPNEVTIGKSENSLFFEAGNLVVWSNHADSLHYLDLPAFDQQGEMAIVATFRELYRSIYLLAFVAGTTYVTPALSADGPKLKMGACADDREGSCPVPVKVINKPMFDAEGFGLHTPTVLSALQALVRNDDVVIDIAENHVRLCTTGYQYETVSVLAKID